MTAQSATPAAGPLDAVRVLDLSDDRAIYGGKLLADFGAETIRLEPPDGDPLLAKGPRHSETGASLWHAFFASSRRFIRAQSEAEAIAALAPEADIILDAGRISAAGLDRGALLRRNPSLVIIDVSSFGPDGPWAGYQAPGLVAEALGGVAATSGDVDTPPLRLFGDQYAFVAGVYAAVSALAALRHARQTGQGQVVTVSVHEALSSILEHVLMWAWYQELLPFAQAPHLQRRGSLHWSNAYQVMQAQGGSIMITPTPDFQKQLAWLAEENAHEDLFDEKYADPANLPLLIERSMQILRNWVAGKDVEPFFHEAQSRHHPYGWVMTIPELAANPQLEARDWWAAYDAGGAQVQGPGPPFHMSAAAWSASAAGAPNQPGAEPEPVSAADILAAAGWDD